MTQEKQSDRKMSDMRPFRGSPPLVGPDPYCFLCGGSGAVEYATTVDFCPRCNAGPWPEAKSARKGAA
jgi:hypothetical protein